MFHGKVNNLWLMGFHALHCYLADYPFLFVESLILVFIVFVYV